MFGFAILSLFVYTIAGLLILFVLTLAINFGKHRSFKFQNHPNSECFWEIWGALLITGFLGTLWNLNQGANARGNWYTIFIQMPLYGSLLGGFIGKIIGEKILAKASRYFQRWLMVIAIAFALIALYSYIYTGAISYGDN
jgi:hypothetical protein